MLKTQRINAYILFIFVTLTFSFPSQSSGDNKVLHDFINDYTEHNRKIIVVERGAIRYGDPTTGKTIKLFANKDYTFNSPIEKVECPTLCFNNKKLLISKNNYSENTGKLILIDLDSGIEKILVASTPIISPSISRDNKHIAYLSNLNNSIYSVFVYHVESENIDKIIDNNAIHGGVYDAAISWGDDDNLYYSDKNININVIDIDKKTSRMITHGYDPIISPDKSNIVYKKTDNKPYTPIVYELSSGNTKEIIYPEIFNAIWAPNNESLLVVRNISRIWRWNEWEKEVLVFDLNTMERHKLFTYFGYEYIDCK